jgi:uncharacterized MAPEG superfamily protein
MMMRVVAMLAVVAVIAGKNSCAKTNARRDARGAARQTSAVFTRRECARSERRETRMMNAAAVAVGVAATGTRGTL